MAKLATPQSCGLNHVVRHCQQALQDLCTRWFAVVAISLSLARLAGEPLTHAGELARTRALRLRSSLARKRCGGQCAVQCRLARACILCVSAFPARKRLWRWHGRLRTTGRSARTHKCVRPLRGHRSCAPGNFNVRRHEQPPVRIASTGWLSLNTPPPPE